MKTPYTLAISSFAVHGTASLKTFITILGEKILPVPSLMLNGLTNMSLVKKLEIPFTELLESSFELAAARDLDLILYIGYLADAAQVEVITGMIQNYRQLIKTIIVDPVCGDHGRSYVPGDVIAAWPQLIGMADMVFPNFTEIKILTGHQPDATGDANFYIEKFRTQFPATELVVTSFQTGENNIGIKYFGDETYSYSHPILPKSYGGTGDAFLASFILSRFYGGMDIKDALKHAADTTYHIIKTSIENNSTDLLLSAGNNL